MYIPNLNWMEQIKNVVNEAIGQKNFVMEGTVTSISQKAPYMVKVMLEPYEIETGWLLVGSPYVGNQFGVVLPPPEEGTVVKVLFDMGDLNHGLVICSTYNDNTSMPVVSFGAAGIFHKSGSSIVMNPDGSIVLTSKGGASITLGADKTVTISGNTTQSW